MYQGRDATPEARDDFIMMTIERGRRHAFGSFLLLGMLLLPSAVALRLGRDGAAGGLGVKTWKLFSVHVARPSREVGRRRFINVCVGARTGFGDTRSTTHT